MNLNSQTNDYNTLLTKKDDAVSIDIENLKVHRQAIWDRMNVEPDAFPDSNFDFRRKYISTGFDSLDGMLGGGVQVGDILEICGKPMTGKTRICTQVMLCFQSKYDNGKIIYIHSELPENCLFALKRSLSSSLNENEVENMLDRVYPLYTKTVLGLIETLESVYSGEFKEDGSDISNGDNRDPVLIVIDCISDIFSLYLRENKATTIQAQIFSIQRCLHKLARKGNSTILVTNGLVSSEKYIENKRDYIRSVVSGVGLGGEERQLVGEWDGGVKPALGLSWLYCSNHRIHLLNTGETEVDKDESGKITTRTKIKAVLMRSTNLKTGLSCFL
ncbi:hypothetical protein BB559_006177 [Furculomyces boomerangus]|uniref:RecA family profile 1 domain-containing protein n=2 Tax=Harpellales TaxID=61421 RepID=A0A2T9Y476_9FUNG|nr:hypothetical protein BB559_006177 [Furculomyces boomerangus]PWA03195.1 hypothetical protein BB558_000619 [Smittium angustum]